MSESVTDVKDFVGCWWCENTSDFSSAGSADSWNEDMLVNRWQMMYDLMFHIELCVHAQAFNQSRHTK